MRLGYDFDGVTVDTGKIRADIALTLWGINIPPERFKSEFVVGAYLSVRKYQELTRIVSTGEVGLAVEPMPEALRYIRLLGEQRHHQAVVTSRLGKRLTTAKRWSKEHGISIPHYGVGNRRSKAPFLCGYDAYMDDDVIKLEDLVGIVPHLFLYSHEYNLHHKLPAGIIRVDSWRAYYGHIERLSQEGPSASPATPLTMKCAAGGSY